MSQKITEEEILNLAARIAVQAKIDGVKKSQIENLLTSVEISSDPKISPNIVALYAYRQAERNEIGRGTAVLISEAMSRLSEAGGGREEARKLLGFMKWIYESLGERRIPRVTVKELKFQDVLKILKGG